MAGFQTGADELVKAAQQMENSNQQLQSNLSQLANEVEQIQGAWVGEAAAAFQTLMNHFNTDAKNLNDSLQQISEAVSGSATNYRQQEQEAQQSLSSITQALGG
ncbi:MAG TPA: WXG100 family type VII secretion target [Pseudonocardiaceae bacterium]|jgi:WXG100 family type VII secretion target|nr:WXG100 family type VII secretion target [Pseudonocardiaceae bacterium]